MPDEAQETDPAAASSDSLTARVASEIARQSMAPLAGGLYLVATPIGNLGDITVRALTVLARADIIYCEDTRHSRTLLSHYGIRATLRPYHEHNAEAERPRILSAVERGQVIGLISDAGTPLVSDPGFKLVREAVEKKLSVTALPGPSAVLAGLAVSGLATDTFLFAGFLPAKEGAKRQRLEELATIQATLILFEAPSRLARSLAGMDDVFKRREIVVARELTKRFEEVKRGTAATLARWAEASDPKGEFVILVAPPGVREISDADIETMLAEEMQTQSLRDAVRQISEQLAVPKSRVYDLGLKMKQSAKQPEQS